MSYSNLEYCANLEFQVRASDLKIKQYGISNLCFFCLRMSTEDVGEWKSTYNTIIMETSKQEKKKDKHMFLNIQTDTHILYLMCS